MAGLLRDIRKLNRLGDRPIAEPFAGGAGASLSLLFAEDAPAVHINDADKAIHDFWWSVTHECAEFCCHIADTPVTIAEWYLQRAIYRDRGRVPRLRKGFAAFFLNRCNRSGIIANGGPIGGVEQKGKWRLNARFNRTGLERRCLRVNEYRDRIGVSAQDGLAFIAGLKSASTFFFIDPPYFAKGGSLYMNSLSPQYHAELAGHLRTMNDAAWVVTYDDCAEIREMYKGWAQIRPFSLQYAASERRNGTEILIAPKWVRLPSTQRSAAISW